MPPDSISISSSSSSMPTPSPSPNPNPDPPPPAINYVLSFLLVGLAWGLTTPFIRRAAREHQQQHRRRAVESPESAVSVWGRCTRRMYGALRAAADLLRNPRYAVPLVLNLTGSVWFFLLIGKAELSLTVPIVNTLAFLFTVVGEWWVEGKVISRDTLIGMVLSVGGIALCVHSKSV